MSVMIIGLILLLNIYRGKQENMALQILIFEHTFIYILYRKHLLSFFHLL